MKKQIPCGNDSQKGKGKSRGLSTSVEMTAVWTVELDDNDFGGVVG